MSDAETLSKAESYFARLELKGEAAKRVEAAFVATRKRLQPGAPAGGAR